LVGEKGMFFRRGGPTTEAPMSHFPIPQRTGKKIVSAEWGGSFSPVPKHGTTLEFHHLGPAAGTKQFGIESRFRDYASFFFFSSFSFRLSPQFPKHCPQFFYNCPFFLLILELSMSFFHSCCSLATPPFSRLNLGFKF
jgi:hypothetical protein